MASLCGWSAVVSVRCMCVCVSVDQTVGIIGLTAHTVQGAAESTGVRSWRAPLMPSPLSYTSSLTPVLLSLASTLILIRRERPAKELQLLVARHLPPLETKKKKADEQL